MQAPTQYPTRTRPDTAPKRQHPKAWAFAVGFIAVLLAVGAATLTLRGDDTSVADEPVRPTAAGEEDDNLISVDSLTWSRINLGTEGPGLQITAGGSGLAAVGVYHEPDPNDLADAMSHVGDRVALQGNVDHRLLVEGSFKEIDRAVRDCVQAGGRRGHILNLGSGLDKDTPFDNVCRFIETSKTVVATAADDRAAG